jgi:hypothetical protein
MVRSWRLTRKRPGNPSRAIRHFPPRNLRVGAVHGTIPGMPALRAASSHGLQSVHPRVNDIETTPSQFYRPLGSQRAGKEP